MDYSEGAKYYFFRLMLLIGTNALGLLLGKAIFWCIASLLPPSAEGVKLFLVSDLTGSICAACIMILLLAAVFRDDAKKHAAYEDMDAVPVLITLILLLAAYFIPAVFYDPFDITRAVRTLYYMFYYPTIWLTELFGADIRTAAALGMGIVLAVQFCVYITAYSAYKKEHPFNFRHDEA